MPSVQYMTPPTFMKRGPWPICEEHPFGPKEFTPNSESTTWKKKETTSTCQCSSTNQTSTILIQKKKPPILVWTNRSSNLDPIFSPKKRFVEFAPPLFPFLLRKGRGEGSRRPIGCLVYDIWHHPHLWRGVRGPHVVHMNMGHLE